ncbi:MAG: 4Fe-4S dicluster domain-containing protein [Nitrospinota bacterium]
MTEAVVKEKEKAVIEVSNRLCTGCGICVDVCPAEVLSMVSDNTRVSGLIASIKNLDACTKCMLCEVQCPDFAINVS